MSPDTAGNGKSRTRVGTTRRRAIAALAGVGVLAAVPLAVEAAGGASSAVTSGQKVVVSKKTPAVVRRAMSGPGPVVVAFLLPGMTEDEIVLKRLNNLQREGKFKDSKFIVYRITNSTQLGDLPTLFDVKYTPAVAVIQGDDKLSNVWRGLVDEDIVAQSLIDARAAVPQPITAPPRAGTATGNAAGIALAKKVNARYVKVPGVAVEFTGALPGVGAATGSGQVRLVDGKQRVFGATVTVAGAPAQLYLNSTGLYSKAASASCWLRNTNPTVVRSLGDPMIPLAGVAFGKPAPSKDGTTVSLSARDTKNQYGGGTTTYTVDAATSDLVSAAHGKSTQTFKAMGAAPVLVKPDTLC